MKLLACSSIREFSFRTKVPDHPRSKRQRVDRDKTLRQDANRLVYPLPQLLGRHRGSRRRSPSGLAEHLQPSAHIDLPIRGDGRNGARRRVAMDGLAVVQKETHRNRENGPSCHSILAQVYTARPVGGKCCETSNSAIDMELLSSP